MRGWGKGKINAPSVCPVSACDLGGERKEHCRPIREQQTVQKEVNTERRKEEKKMSTLKSAIGSHDADAIIIPQTGPQLSYRGLRLAVEDFQSQLARHGLHHGQAVSMTLPNNAEFVVSFLAVTAQRCIAAPLNPAYKQPEFEFYINDINSAMVLVPKGHVAKQEAAVRAARSFGAAIAEVSWDMASARLRLEVKEKGKKLTGSNKVDEPQPGDIALILHTSGTTGRPKAVPLTHENLTSTMRNIVDTYKLSTSDRTLLVMPLFHVHGLLCALLAPLQSGGSLIIPTKFSAGQFWKDFIDYKANWYTAVPTIHQILLRNPPPSPRPEIRFIRSCSSALAPTIFHQLEKTFGAPVVEAYAMTEASHQMTSNALPPDKRKAGTVGRGFGVEVKILNEQGKILAQGEEGEICARGANVTKGYLNNDKANRESFTKEGYFRTGDQGKIDPDGYVIITGRIKELINRGGEKIAPAEIDDVLLQHPAVQEAVAFAVPDEMYGQEVNAAIVLKEGKKADQKELQSFVLGKMAKFKVPKVMYFTDNMPKTATGKIQRRVMVDIFVKPKSKL